ncbi:hypothetical protein H1R20_g15421, partial [Candolleomyces eurysporus]
MSMLQPSYIPYTHSEPLFVIPEVLEIEDTRTNTMISGFPSSVLSNVLTFLVNSCTSNNPSQPAHDLLRVSHVDSHLRKACLGNPALWNQVLSLNGISPRFFSAIVERSGTLPLSLSVREDGSLSTGPEVWSLLMDILLRIRSLDVEVDEGYEGTKARFLLALLTINAPALEECVIVFHGQRSVPLNCFIPHGRTPRLRQLELINCFIPLDRCHFPQLASIAVRSINGEPTLPSPYDCLRFHVQFRYLRQLVLWNAVQQSSTPNQIIRPPPVELPFLEALILLGSGAACKQLAEVFRIPSECNRSVTIQFPGDCQCTSADATAAALAACSFIPEDLKYTACLLESTSVVQALKFSTPSQKGTAKFSFLIGKSLDFPAFGPISFLLKASAYVPFISWLPGFAMTAQDAFLFTLWQSLSLTCNNALSSVDLLNLSFDGSSAAPHFLVPLFESMPNIAMVAAMVPQVYSNPSFLNITGRKELFPKLDTLGIPLNRSKADLTCLPQLLRHRQGIRNVLFYICPVWSGQVRSTIQDLTKDFPENVEIGWMEN